MFGWDNNDLMSSGSSTHVDYFSSIICHDFISRRGEYR